MIRELARAAWRQFRPEPVHERRMPDRLGDDASLLTSESTITIVEGPPKRIVAELVVGGKWTPVVFSPEGAHRFSDDLLRAVAQAMKPRRADPHEHKSFP
jgi:hypothetical protein